MQAIHRDHSAAPFGATANQAHRYQVLDSLRGVCACMVVLLHFGSNSHIGRLAVVQNGFLFVDFFFVLSGFVVSFAYANKIESGFSIPAFMGKRFARIYQLHLAVLLMFVFFELFFLMLPSGYAIRTPFTVGYSPARLAESLFLVQVFFGPDKATWNGPSWSIAAEFWTYLLIAFVYRLGRRLLVVVCLGLAAISAIILSFATDRYMNVFHDVAIFRCLFGYAAGVLVWRALPAIERLGTSRSIDTLLEFATVTLCVVFVSYAGAGPASIAAPVVFAFAVLVFSRQQGAISAVLLTNPARQIGQLSYSIYLVHLFLLYRFVNVLSVVENKTGIDLVATVDGHTTVSGSAIIADALTAVFLGLTIGVAWMTYNFIELPGQAVWRRFGERQLRTAKAQ